MASSSVDQTIITNRVQDDLVYRWVESFLISRKAGNLSLHTVKFYRVELSQFISYCGDQVVERISQITSDILRRYLLFLEEKGRNPGGLHAAFRALRAFLLWFEEENELDSADWKNPIHKVKAPKVPKVQLDPVSLETVQLLMDVCGKDFYGTRDKALLCFLLDTGTRAAECLAVNLEDLDRINGAVQIRQGKGKKARTVFLAKQARRSVRAYLRLRTDSSKALWISDELERLTYSGLRQIIRRLAKRAAIKAPTLHDFRRAFAIECLRNGMDIYSLQNLMGHSDLQVLRIYLKQTEFDLQEAHQRGSPVDRLKEIGRVAPYVGKVCKG